MTAANPMPFAAAPIPSPGVSGVSYFVAVLFLVCVGAYITVKVLYGRGPMTAFGGSKRLMRVLDRFPLAPQRYLMIMEIGGKLFLIGVTEQAISLLTTLDTESLSKDLAWFEQNEGNTSFNSYLSALSRRWKKNKKEPPDG